MPGYLPISKTENYYIIMQYWLKYFLLEAKQYMNNQVRDILAGSDVPPV
jgi:hypothetical protein